VTVRVACAADFAAVVALNAADVRHLSPLTVSGLERLARIACRFTVAEIDGRIGGVLLAIPWSAVHDSVNFRWFKERYASFIYIDRIVVADDVRRAGIASRLYEDVEEHARLSGASRLACEINVRPANPGSFAFHDRQGFLEVGAQDIDRDAKTVSMRLKQLSPASHGSRRRAWAP